MAEISRLKNSEISNGNLINADDLDAEFNQLVNESNSQNTRIDNLESGNATIGGEKTFSSNISLDGIDEATNDNGVKIDNGLVTIKDGCIQLSSVVEISSASTITDIITTNSPHGLLTATPVEIVAGSGGVVPTGLTPGTAYYARYLSDTTLTLHTSAANASSGTSAVDITAVGESPYYLYADPLEGEGKLWYSPVTQELKLLTASGVVTLASSSDAFPKGYRNGPPIEYVSSTEVKIPENFCCRDDSNTVNISFSNDETIDITTSTGAGVTNALMNGLTETNSTWYYIWAIAQSDGSSPKGLLTTSSTTIATPPTDYSVKRLLGAVRNDGSGNFIPFSVGTGWPYRPIIKLNVAGTYYSSTSTLVAGAAQVLSAGTATSFTNIDLSDFVPAISKEVIIRTTNANTGSVHAFFNFRPDGSSNEGDHFASAADLGNGIYQVTTSDSQVIEYRATNASGGRSVTVDVVAFVLTELT